MLYKLLLLLIMTPSGFFISWFLRIAVPLRRPLLYSLLVAAALDLTWVINQMILPQPSAFLNVITYPVLFILLYFFTERGYRFRAYLVQGILAVTPILLVYILASVVMPLAQASGMDPKEFSQVGGAYYLPMTLLLNCSSWAAMYGVAQLLRKILGPADEAKGLLWFISIPITQMMLIVLFINLAFLRSGFLGFYLCIFLGMVLCIASDVACILGYRKYVKMQGIRRQLQEAHHQLDLQAEHYRSLQSDILSVNQIRHDLKNQLQAAYYLLEKGNPQEVRRQLDLLNLQLSQKVGSQYCENLMVDAVLTEKAALCRSKQISLQISAPVPQHIALENAYLCSAFSNLLDNSIQAVCKTQPPLGPIDLSTDLQGAYLTIRCSNPACEPEKSKESSLLRAHGLGISILQQIAEMGQGTFYTDYQNGVFTAVLILKR